MSKNQNVFLDVSVANEDNKTILDERFPTIGQSLKSWKRMQQPEVTLNKNERWVLMGWNVMLFVVLFLLVQLVYRIGEALFILMIALIVHLFT